MAEVFTREQLKTDIPEFIDIIQKGHQPHPDVQKALYVDHKPVVNLCHTRGYFVIMTLSNNKTYYIQYEMAYIITDVELSIVARRLNEVIFYDDYSEYEAARVKRLSAVSLDKQDGLNLN